MTVSGETIGEIEHGLLVFIGVGAGDDEMTCRKFAGKTAKLRIFEDVSGKMNLGVEETGGSILAISQFTLYGDARKGNRPSFAEAAPPEKGEALYEHYCAELEAILGKERVKRGRFRAMMDVELVNAGPVTIWLDSGVHS